MAGEPRKAKYDAWGAFRFHGDTVESVYPRLYNKKIDINADQVVINEVKQVEMECTLYRGQK